LNIRPWYENCIGNLGKCQEGQELSIINYQLSIILANIKNKKYFSKIGDWRLKIEDFTLKSP
jgi:hypothetical protein